jgi:hypothetical protein
MTWYGKHLGASRSPDWTLFSLNDLCSTRCQDLAKMRVNLQNRPLIDNKHVEKDLDMKLSDVAI